MSLMADLTRWDGWLHLISDDRNGHDLPRGPLGVVVYVPLALLFRYVPSRWRAAYLAGSSLLTALLTLGPGFALMLAGLAGLGLLLVRTCKSGWWPAVGLIVLAAVYAGFLLFPRPPWLPPMDDPRLAEPTWFYLHWAGIGYLFLRMAHVQADVGRGLLPAPAAVDYFAYLLFPPTLRMGPIYRFGAFAQQLHGDLERSRSLPAAAGRLLAGFIRLGIMAALLKHAPLDRLYGEIDQLNRLSTDRFLAGIYIAPMTIYLWIGGYTDLAVGVGRIMGFTVPENFHYPWVATSIADFWRRWHLTLGAWLRDYIYIPLGGSRRHVTLNYLVTFLFCGLWHGTYPAMVLWGLSQGLGLAVWRVWNRFWARQAERTTPLCRAARRLRLKDGPLGTALAWLLTFHYQILTINVILDERHAGRLMAGRLAELIGLRG